LNQLVSRPVRSPDRGPAQREHQLTGQPLVQRVLADPLGQPGQQLAMPPVPELDVGEVPLGGLVLLAQGDPDTVKPGGVEQAEGLPPPPPEGLLEQRDGAVVGGGGAAARSSWTSTSCSSRRIR